MQPAGHLPVVVFRKQNVKYVNNWVLYRERKS